MLEVKKAFVTKEQEYGRLFNAKQDTGAGTAKDSCCGGSGAPGSQ